VKAEDPRCRRPGGTHAHILPGMRNAPARLVPAALALAVASLSALGCQRGDAETFGPRPAALPRAASRAVQPSRAPGVPGVYAPTASAAVAQAGGVAARHVRTVFLVLMENKTWAEVKGSPSAPYLNRELLPRASVAEAYRGAMGGELHPSEPNYVWLEAGDNLGITSDDDPAVTHQATKAHLVTLLEAANVTWKAYQEDIPGDGCPLHRAGDYRPKHDPMVFFDDVTNGNDPGAPRCKAHVRPLTELASDLEDPSKTPRYAFITPNQCHDMHDSCWPTFDRIRQGDDWLATWMPRILSSAAYAAGGAVFITWDEAEHTDAEVLEHAGELSRRVSRKGQRRQLFLAEELDLGGLVARRRLAALELAEEEQLVRPPDVARVVVLRLVEEREELHGRDHVARLLEDLTGGHLLRWRPDVRPAAGQRPPPVRHLAHHEHLAGARHHRTHVDLRRRVTALRPQDLLDALDRAVQGCRRHLRREAEEP
jgi:phosphatidylinositol-3-phosphatase